MKRNLAPTCLLATLAITAFAGNSLLARAALADGAIEVGAYSFIRLASGALVLLPLLHTRPSRKDLPGATALAIYVAGFSLAYLHLDAGLGALVLFGFVQGTILIAGVWRGERYLWTSWLGIGLAMAGLVYVLAPWRAAQIGAEAIQPGLLMATAGIAWGTYTLIGRQSDAYAGGATGSTARNFLLASLFVAPMLAWDSGLPSLIGIGLAVTSGVATSALGYVMWYKVAPTFNVATIASVQLATPIVAALGGVAFLSERIAIPLLIGGVMILSGIALTLRQPSTN